MNTGIISVVITVHNIAPYLEKCLESVCHQTYDNLEIIIIDDGSKDESGKICDRYAGNDNRIRAFHIENMGAVNARKIGARMSTGEYLSIIDGDDWLETDMLEKLHTTLQKYDVDISMCGRYEDGPNGSKLMKHGIPAGRYDKESMVKYVYPRMIVGGDFFEWGIFPSLWDKLFKREVLLPYLEEVEEVLPMGNDAACVYPCLLHAESIYLMDECLYHYRQSAFSMVRSIKDISTYRKGFTRLYNSVNDSLKKAADIFDLTKQWLEYVLFLMIPRADVLYEGIEGSPHLFPFPGVEKGSRIILYGMGLFGQRMYRYIKDTGFCDIVMAVDQSYECFPREYDVKSPDRMKDISENDYDAIVVTLSFAHTQNQVFTALRQICPSRKIFFPDKEYAFREESLIALGIK